MKPASPEAVKLMLEGSAAMADAEENGIRIDVPYLDEQIVWTKEKSRDLEAKLRKDDVYKLWRREYGEKADIASPTQLAHIVFEVMGETSKIRTATGRHSTSADALEDVDLPFVRRWLDIQTLEMLRNTFLLGIKRETVLDRLTGYHILHNNFNLHTAVTFRSSSSDINFQNFPNRDKRQAKIVRQAFIPRDGCALLEIDFGQAEIRAACSYHHDPVMIQYLIDDFDFHKEIGAELFKLKVSQVSNPIRQVGKGGYVFPSFYGDWYKSICQKVWRAVDQEKLTTTDGILVRDHLTKIGITELGDLRKGDPRPGTFEHHVKKVDDRFWNERFAVYSQWKKDWWEAYLKKGYYRMHTGFVSQGIFRRNECINGPIQGSAFHWLLWSCIQLNKWLKKNGMRTLLVGQIHDSIMLDAPLDEVETVLAAAHRIITQELPRYYRWINVPVVVDAKISKKNWFEKEKIGMAA